MSDAAPSKLPGLPALRSGIKPVDEWAKLVNEHLEVRAGARGSRSDRATTQRDLDALAERVSSASKGTADIDVLVDALLANPRFQAAIKRRSTATAVATPTRPDVSGEGRLLDIERRIRAVERKNYGSVMTYGQGFEFVPGKNRWRLKNEIGFAESTIGDTARTLYRIFFAPAGQQEALAAEVHASGASLNDMVRIGSPSDPNAWTLRRITQTVSDLGGANYVMQQRFDGSGRIRPEHTAQWVSPDGTRFDMQDVINGLVRRTDVLRTYTGYPGQW